MRDTTKYIITFVLIMTMITAFILAGMNTFLKPIHDLNETVYNKKSVLLSIADEFDKPIDAMTVTEVQEIFNEQIEGKVVDAEGNEVEDENVDQIIMADELKKPKSEQHYPLYIFNKADGSKIYIVSIRGSGLWDAIWGNVAINQDLVTIEGVSFDHVSETPGLGAEIKDNPSFPASFEGKKLYDESGNYTSVQVVKGLLREPEHQVEAISGATITMNGVTDMFYEGIQNYEPYFKKLEQ